MVYICLQTLSLAFTHINKMKKRITTLLLLAVTIISSSAFIISSTGYAGYTGSPGEYTCSGGGSCHGGGSSAAAGITITTVPAFNVNLNSQTEYMRDSIYLVSITASASGYSHYGFGCEILDSTNANAGIMQNPGPGVKFLYAGARKNAVHSTPKSGSTVSFTFKWIAPSGGGATIYAIANAVNLNGATSGDFVIPPVSLSLVAAPAPPPDTTVVDVGIKENKLSGISQISIFPNPAHDVSNISYYLQQSKIISIELVDISGKTIKQLYRQEDTPGYHAQVLNLQGIASGVYFIKTSANEQKVSQKLITVQ
jgi:hypothetical protein